MTSQILIILLLMVGNGLFAMAEIALVSARKTHLQRLAEEGDSRAKTALDLASNPTQFLSTVQVGITLIGILAGAVGGTTIAGGLAEMISTVQALAPYSQSIALGIVVVGLTFLSLIVGELVPKRIALSNPEGIARFLARPVEALSRVAAPLVDCLSAPTEWVLKMLGIGPASEAPVSDEEVRILIDEGLNKGVFDKAEKELMESVLELDDLDVGDLMTPRAKIIWLDVDAPEEENWRRIASTGYSYFPVYQKHRDNVVGVISVKSLWANQSLTGHAAIRPLLTKPFYVPATMQAMKLLEVFRNEGRHNALVSDEFGGVHGLVTLTDVFEALVGEMPSRDKPRRMLVQRKDEKSWLIDGMISIEALQKALDIEELPGEDDAEYQTLGGLVVQILQRIPQEGNTFDLGAYRFEVVDMDRTRVDKVLVSRLEEPAPKTATPPEPE